jgi:uroporphyrinogen decarboxylase
MTKREIVKAVLNGERPPYVPWAFSFTHHAHERIKAHYGVDNIDDIAPSHLLSLGHGIGFFTDIGDNRVRDIFGVTWDREVDKDIGVVEGCVLDSPTLAGYTLPDPHADMFFSEIPTRIAECPDRFRVFSIGFSLYERAWTLRGMENLMMDFYDNPGFVRELFNAIADYNIAQVEKALTYDIDAVYFGDDWGSQRGLQMGPKTWREFIAPVLTRMYRAVRAAGKHVFIHSCGGVDELFDDLIDLGVNCFNPFQPEVMDVFVLLDRYRGRLSFHGGLSTQRTLPYGTPADVRAETLKLLEAGAAGSYIFSPAHSVPGDVPTENMVAFIETVLAQT